MRAAHARLLVLRSHRLLPPVWRGTHDGTSRVPKERSAERFLGSPMHQVVAHRFGDIFRKA